jgi:hypothetical protein
MLLWHAICNIITGCLSHKRSTSKQAGFCPMWIDLCVLRIIGLIFDLLIVVCGIVTVVYTTKWASRNGWVGQPYCIALLAAIVYATYAITSYDTLKLKFDCRPPYTQCNAPAHQGPANAEDTNASSKNENM